MGYLLYSTVFSLLFISTVLFLTRSLWLNTMLSLPGTSFLYSRLPASFSADIENGLSSSAFDLSGNVAAGDSRRGLDDMSKREIQKIMKSRRVNFDEARRIHTEGRFAKNNIGPDGLPRDPKFVSFS
ncbi:probable protein precursor [Rhynchosporium agropyri]|uniref:Probable protein n=1 Tax=Rhynchosporium agropyri TaxID=914238 RepID=A0A1E1K7G0_9HELO|nr:probable protein precursor [Rhynchosporium agropyri]